MKKSILSCLLCIVLMVACLSACTQVHTHTLVRHDALSASCLSMGNIEYYECKSCGKLFSDNEGTKEISSKDVKTSATGHSFSDSWSGDDEYHWHAATCGHDETKDTAAHNFVDYKCTDCNALSPAGKSTTLAKAATPKKLSQEEKESENLANIVQSANAFANKLSEVVYNNYNKEENFTISPISVYMALSIAAECAAGTTREEILSALGITHEQLESNFNLLYRLLNVKYTDDDGDIAGMVDLSNSIWVDESLYVEQPLLQSLADNFFCNSNKVDFYNENALANRAIQNFVKEKTRGLIDKNFKLKEETVFALINTLYLKDIWNAWADLEFTQDTYTFNEGSNQAKTLNFLEHYYTSGRAYEEETFTHYYAATTNGYKLKFILPKSGHSVRDVFTAQNIALVNAITDYYGKDCDNKKHYFTRCLFPEFNASYNDDLSSILQSQFGINDLFDKYNCDFSSLTGQPAYCSGVAHATELKVDKTGIEGAAVTVIGVDGAGGPDDCEEVYLDFVLDRSFGFIITDRNDAILFTGVVENV